MLLQVARSSRHVPYFDHRILCVLREGQRLSLRTSHPLLRQQTSPPQLNYFGLSPFSTSTTLCRRYLISEGRTTTPPSEDSDSEHSFPRPFYLETGYSIFAKRPSRPFPPPFVAQPSGSFSEPLTSHNPVRGRRPAVNGEPVRGITNGDDAIIIGDKNFLAVNDGVGAWAQKERGHAALWSRLIAHFWAVEIEKSFQGNEEVDLKELDPIRNLQDAYEQTKAVTKGSLKEEGEEEEGSGEETKGHTEDKGHVHESSSSPAKSKSRDNASSESGEGKDPNDILGTTTASSALLHYKAASSDPTPVVLATTLGDCKVLLVRPSSKKVLYRSKEQWHWFDCPRQLGTNSPDTPVGNAVMDTVEIEVGDVVAVLSDGVTDNLWEHEICEHISDSVEKWGRGDDEARDGIVYVARTLMNAAREVAQDPNAESPYMERAFDEGIAAEGGKLDDISVVLGVCRKRE